MVSLQKITLLGIEFNSDLSDLHKNFEKKIDSIVKTAAHWRYRFLSPYGKNTIAKSLLLSKISHIAIILPCINNAQINKLEKIIYEFIWGGENMSKVARVDSKLSERRGGLNPFVPRSHLWLCIEKPEEFWRKKLSEPNLAF